MFTYAYQPLPGDPPPVQQNNRNASNQNFNPFGPPFNPVTSSQNSLPVIPSTSHMSVPTVQQHSDRSQSSNIVNINATNPSTIPIPLTITYEDIGVRRSIAQFPPLHNQSMAVDTSTSSQPFKYWKSHQIPTQERVLLIQSQYDETKYCNYSFLLYAKQELDKRKLIIIEVEPNYDSLYHCFARYLYPGFTDVDRIKKADELKTKCRVYMERKEMRINVKNQLRVLNKATGARIKMYSKESSTNSIHSYNSLHEITIQYTESGDFNEISLLRYSDHMYYLVAPYPHYSAKSNSELQLHDNLGKRELEMAQIEAEWKLMKDCMSEMMEYMTSPTGYDIPPRYTSVLMQQSACDIPMSSKVAQMMEIVHSNFMDSKSSTTTTSTSAATVDSEMKMDVDFVPNLLADTNYVIRSGHEEEDVYIEPIRYFLQRNGLNDKCPKIAIKKDVRHYLNQDEVLCTKQPIFVISKKRYSQLWTHDSCQLIAQCDIGKHVVIGQYLGVCVLDTEYEEIYDGTTHKAEYELFAHSAQIDSMDKLDISIDALRLQKQYGIYVPFLSMKHAKDCDEANVVFITVFVNDWPSIFALTTRQISKGQELKHQYPGNSLKRSRETKNRLITKMEQIRHIKDTFQSLNF